MRSKRGGMGPGAGGRCEGVEGVLSELGSFGRYQLALLVLLAFRDSFLAMCNYHYVFTVADVPFRCKVEECEAVDPKFNASWTKFALPENKVQCMRLARNNSEIEDRETCVAGYFDPHVIEPCRELVYENYNSIVAEFNLGCEPWKWPLVGTVHNIGLIISYLLSGFVSDRYGRKFVIVGAPLVVGVAGLAKSFSHSYWVLIILEFLESALGYGNASMVLSLETVSQKRRVMYSCASDLLASFGGAFFGLIAWKVPYWRHLMRAIYAPLLVIVFYIFLVDEGVRWLLAHDRQDEAVRVVHKVAKINNITLSAKAQQVLQQITDDNQESDQTTTSKECGVMRSLRSRRVATRVVLLSLCFFCCFFVYNAIIIQAASVPGDKYTSFSVTFVVAIVARALTAVTLTCCGRRGPICVSYCLCSAFFIASAFAPKSAGWWASAAFVAGALCSSFGTFSMTVLALEVFPTTARNSLTNLATTLGRFGSVLAPQAPALARYMEGLPSLVFGLAALGPAVLALALPETSSAALPACLADAEKLGQTDDAGAKPQQTSNDTIVEKL